MKILLLKIKMPLATYKISVYIYTDMIRDTRVLLYAVQVYKICVKVAYLLSSLTFLLTSIKQPSIFIFILNSLFVFRVIKPKKKNLKSF